MIESPVDHAKTSAMANGSNDGGHVQADGSPPGSPATPSDNTGKEQHHHPHHRHFGLHRRKSRQSSVNDVDGAGAGRRRGAPTRLLSLGNARAFSDHFGREPTSAMSDDGQTPTNPVWHPQGATGVNIAPRRTSLPGAKPVAPSWHPNAPDVLKVKAPNDAVLLPQLPLATMVSNPKTSTDEGISIQDRVVQSSIVSTVPDSADVLDSETVKLQRPSIKVRIITWNQGNSVPKGDLGVLLGRVGEYISPEAGWDESSDEEEGPEEARNKAPAAQGNDPSPKPKRRHRGMGVAGQEGIPRKDRIPPLPHDDAHPYHVIVIAGQECPWGDGKRISTGVGLAGELGDLSRSKSRAAEIARRAKAKEREREKTDKHAIDAHHHAGEGKGDAEDSPLPQTPGVVVSSEEDPFTNAIPLTPGGVSKARSGGRGWSEMCEDWLCRGPLAQATATKGLALATSAAISNLSSGVQSPLEGFSPFQSRSPSPDPTSLTASTKEEDEKRAKGEHDDELVTLPPPVHVADPSLPASIETPTKRVTLAVPKRMIRTLSRPRLDSDAKSDTSRKASVPVSNNHTPVPGTPIHTENAFAKEFENASLSKPDVHSTEPANALVDPSKKQHHSKAHRLAIRIPGLSGTHHVTVQSDGTPLSLGAYELVSKERCYMMYTAVYVWRGCLDRVRGTSQGHVKSGLLAGRVGNKGAVGIALKLGSTRLLFVNAHLAAHEGKVAERIANVEKIKKELKVDTFLPKDDPRNNDDDITSCFDYAFWFGDLNFRVDITRKHADWLMMKKQYDHALAFDQLRKIMKEKPHIFHKFQEAPITFPPTFKFDVLKTIKMKKQQDEEKLRKLRLGNGKLPHHQESLTDDASEGGLSPLANSASSHTIFGDRNGDDASSISSAKPSSSHGGNASDMDEAVSSPTSVESIGPQSLPRSEDMDDVVAHNTAAAEGHGMHSRAIKARRRFMNVVQSAVGAVAHSFEDTARSPGSGASAGDAASIGRESLERQRSRSTCASQVSNSASQNSDPIASRKAIRTAATNSRPDARVAGDQAVQFQSFAVDPQSDSSDFQLHSANVTSSERRSSVIAIVSPNSASTSAANESAESGEGEEGEIQLYDTSAKQRVQSWCDRVLWRSNVEIPPDDNLTDNGSESGPTKGLTSRFANALSRLHVNRSDILPSVIRDRSPQHELGRDDLIPAQRATGMASNDGLPSENGLQAPVTAPAVPAGRRWFSKGHPHLPEVATPKQMQRASTMAAIDSSLSNGARTPKDLPKITTGEAISTANPPTAVNRSDSADDVLLNQRKKHIWKQRQQDQKLPLLPSASSSTPQTARPRKTSLNFEWPKRRKMSSPNPSPLSQGFDQSEGAALDEDVSKPRSVKRSSSATDAGRESRKGGYVTKANHREKRSDLLAPLSAPSARFPRSATTANDSSTTPSAPRRPSRWNDFVMNHISPLLNSQGSMATALANLGFRSSAGHADASANADTSATDVADSSRASEPVLVGPKKGEVHCLLYKSLNDREMRLLEGRSDHRPVIFVGSIGVGQS